MCYHLLTTRVALHAAMPLKLCTIACLPQAEAPLPGPCLDCGRYMVSCAVQPIIVAYSQLRAAMFEGSSSSTGPLQRLRFEARPRFVLLGTGAARRGAGGCQSATS